MPEDTTEIEPAFPGYKSTLEWSDSLNNYQTILTPVSGMSLRDYFAGQALIGLLADNRVTDTSKEFARVAYNIANEMMAERQK